MALRLSAILGAAQPFDPTHRYTTSWILPPLFLAIFRTILSLYAFTTTFFILGWEGTHGRLLENRLYHSYFTHLTYWGLAFYFLFSSLHTFRYAFTGASWLQRWPVALQVAHAVFYTTIVTFPILVTAVFWAVIYSGVWFADDFGAWTNVRLPHCSELASNGVTDVSTCPQYGIRSFRNLLYADLAATSRPSSHYRRYLGTLPSPRISYTRHPRLLSILFPRS